MGKYIVIHGNVVDGLVFYGPFDSPGEALTWASERFDIGDWRITSLLESGED